MPDLKQAFRTLIQTPFLTAVAVLSLALGIGANAAIFSLFDQMLLRSLPVRAPDRLVNLEAPGPKPGSQSCNQAGDCDVVFSYPMFRDLQEADASLAGLAGHRSFGANLAFRNQTRNGQGMMVSGSYFPLLGVQPALGRLFTRDDDRTIGEHSVAVLSHRYWETRLGSDPDVLGQSIVVNGHPMTVVGVAPRDFEGTTLGARPDVFVPLSMRGTVDPGFDAFENRRSYWVYVFGRLADDADLRQARAELNTTYASILDEVEAPLQEGMSDQTMARFREREVVVEEGSRGQSQLHGEARTPLIFLLAVTGLVLLIACANIANLLLARGASRNQEMAVRASLGADRTRLMVQLLSESLILALIGGVASVLVASWTLGFIGSILPPEAAETLTLELRPAVLVFTGAVALGTGFLFGFYPALHGTRTDLAGVLRSGGGQASGARAASRFRSSLVTLQIALSMALLVAAGLFIRSLVNVSRVELGLEPENLVTFTISPELNGWEPERSRALFREVEEELAALPGVTGVSGAMVPVLAGNSWGTDVSVEGFESGPDVDDGSRLNAVGPGYFRTLGISLIAGREFTTSDDIGSGKVAVVNEAFARKFGLDGPNAVGRWMSRSGRSDELDMQIVGLVEDARYAQVKDEVPPLFFTPYRQDEDLGSLSFYVRTAVEPDRTTRAIPGVVARLAPNLPVENLKTMEQQVRESVFMDRVIGTLSSAFAGLATVLAAIGLYGVLAYTVARRTREIGLRMALGAGSREVRAMILRQVARMTLVGGAVGIVAALGLGRIAGSLLFELDGFDAGVTAVVSVVLGVVALAAGYLPALRASRVDPMRALRYE